MRISDWSSDVCSSDLLHISSPDANAAPLIYPNQFEDEEDVRVLTAGIRMARTIASQDALSRFVVTELRPGAAASSDEEIKEYIRQRGQTSYHPIGTCKMGRDDWAVVDDGLRVRGESGRASGRESGCPDG